MRPHCGGPPSTRIEGYPPGHGKRIVLFLAVNVLVVVTISILLNILGIRPYLTAHGIDYRSLLALLPRVGHGGRVHLARAVAHHREAR